MNPWHNARLLAWLANALTTIALLVFALAVVGYVATRPYFELRHVEIGAAPGSALRHTPVDELAAAIRSAPRGNFFTIRLDALQARMEQVPWVRSTSVRRMWPDRLIVSVEEHRAKARWSDGRLINVHGELFDAKLDDADADAPLPQLGGPDGSERAVLERFSDLSRMLDPLGLSPVSVNLSPRRAWSALLSDGTELLIGRERGVPLSDRIARWVQAYPLVTERLQRRAAVIDLRYANGFAVRSLEPLEDDFSIDDLLRTLDTLPGIGGAHDGKRSRAGDGDARADAYGQAGAARLLAANAYGEEQQ